jgi:hypothetical protein
MIFISCVQDVFSILSAFNLNIELSAPECMIPDIKYWQKFAFIEILPIACVIIMWILYLCVLMYKLICLNKSKVELYSHRPSLTATCLVMYRLLFLNLTRTSMDVMNCAPTDVRIGHLTKLHHNAPLYYACLQPPDGHEYMSGLLDIPCWEAGSLQVILFPFALTTLLGYTLVVPLYFLWFLRRHKEAIITDQLLRSKELGDDTLTNPKYYDFRRTWSKLYYHFKPGRWYWEIVIFARKAALALSSLMFRSSPSYQLALALLILFAAYVGHVRAAPYLTHAGKAQVIMDHQQKTLTSPMHALVEADMRAAEKRNVKKRHRTNLFELRNKRTAAQNAIFMVFDYNTAESIMLASAVLTVLAGEDMRTHNCCMLHLPAPINSLPAGIMFDSNRFAADNLMYYKAEYDSLTAATISMIACSIVFWVVVFCVDLAIILCPGTANSVLSMCTKVSIATQKVGKALTRRRTFGSRSGSGRSSELVLNPLMLRNEMKVQVALEDSTAGEPLHGDGIVDANEVAKVVGMPTPGLWRAVQLSYGRLVAIQDILREKANESKKLAATLSAVMEDSPTQDFTRPLRSRKQFNAVQNGPSMNSLAETAQLKKQMEVFASLNPANNRKREAAQE